MTKRDKKDPFETVAGKLYDALVSDDSTAWTKPWTKLREVHRPGFAPLSIAGKPYNGINALILGLVGAEYDEPRGPWLTFKRAKDLGAKIEKGEKGTAIILFKPVHREEENDQGEKVRKTHWIRRFYYVWHASQINWDGSDFDLEAWRTKHLGEAPKPEEVKPQAWEDLAICDAALESFLDRSKCTLTERPGDRAYYQPGTHSIVVPTRAQFNGTGAAGFWATTWHECAHATGHKTILSREFGGSFGSQQYAVEEVVAESGAAITCAILDVHGGDHVDQQHLGYIRGWLKKAERKEGAKALVYGINRGRRAAEYICDGFVGETAEATD